MTTILTTEAADQLALREALETRPALLAQMGRTAFEELATVITALDAAPRISSIWIDTLYPSVLALLERERPDLRLAVGRVRRVLHAAAYHGPRIPKADQRQTACAFDTREEMRGDR
jgi:hypothetical protein